MLGDALGYSAYFILPGAGSLYKFFSDMLNFKDGIASVALNTLGLGAFSKVANIGGPVVSFAATVFIYEKLLEYVPLIITTVIGALVFVYYILQLAKYYYISPFVVVFSLTTRNTHKIAEFLVTGITIFCNLF
ncbi:hypothetical protein BKH41_08840 [Helicobacter sp. 12S02232-10]|nr:hypothetical protein BKH41_08840 [Helicobacter sp. 12S02232-10]